MKRLRRRTMALCVVTGVLGVSGCRPVLRPYEPKPIIFDPFDTPFAVVEAKPDQANCTLPERKAATWMAVPAPKQNPALPPQPHRFDGDAGFCVYQWKNDKTLPTPDHFKEIAAVPDGATVSTRDYPHSKIPLLPDSVSGPLLNTFERLARDIDPVRWKDLASRRLDHPTKPVKVAVLDTTPKDLNGQDLSLHGFAVSRVIGTVLCRDPNSRECSDRVRPYLALPMVNSRKADFENGGFFGTFFQLYDALSQALSEWTPSKENLVINLSLGWDPIKADGNGPNVRRIKELLERASCMGALIVAGAGSPTGTTGPVQPAAFEEFPAPDAKRCEELKVQRLAAPKGKSAAARSSASYAPLVHAVGAVDSQDQRLLADRRWGQPRMTAFGLAVMAPGPSGTPYTQPLTGTSVSTAIVSGIAAAVWSVLPDLDAAGVMALVYQGGVELDGGYNSKRARTEFCLGEHFGPCQDTKVRRAYLCGALAQALAQAVPTETLNCDPSISTEVPRWPTVDRPGLAPRDCRVPDCGIPRGPLPSQLAAGVDSHGVANCPGCVFHINTLSARGTLEGVPRAPTPRAKYLMLVLKTAAVTAGSEMYFAVDPMPVFDLPMAVPALPIPRDTWGATLTWYYDAGLFWTADPEVSIGVTRD